MGVSTAAWVLMAVIAFNGRVTSFTQEFTSQQVCETAKENIRQKLSDGRFALLTCEKK